MRSLGIFVLGLLLGGLLGYALHRPGGFAAGKEAAAESSRGSHPIVGAKEAAREEQKQKDAKILLGDIAAVPFPELYEALSRLRPEEVARLAGQLDNLPHNPRAEAKITAFFKAWAHLDPASALQGAAALHSAEARTTAIGATIAGADPNALGDVAAAIAKLPDNALTEPFRAGFFGLAIENWSKVDPAAAARLLGESKLKEMRMSSAFYSVAKNWAAEDPEAALAWAQRQPPSPFGLSPVYGALIGWWKKDPAAAETYALSQLNGPSADMLAMNFVGQMVDKDPARAAAWVQQIPDANLRQQAYAGLAAQMAFNDPKAALEWSSNLPPEAAASAVGSVVSIWARSDPAAAGKWLEGVTGNMRDSAVSSYSSAIAETDPATALAWTATISDQQKREITQRETARLWLKRDPAAARAWIQQSSLGQESRAELLGSASPSP